MSQNVIWSPNVVPTKLFFKSILSYLCPRRCVVAGYSWSLSREWVVMIWWFGGPCDIRTKAKMSLFFLGEEPVWVVEQKYLGELGDAWFWNELMLKGLMIKNIKKIIYPLSLSRSVLVSHVSDTTNSLPVDTKKLFFVFWVCFDTCLQTIQRLASSIVANSTNAKPRDAPNQMQEIKTQNCKFIQQTT